MNLKKGIKIKLFNCNDEFIIEEIDEYYRVKIKKLKTGITTWINKKLIDKIVE